MKPLLRTVVAVCLLLATHAHPENIEEVKELPQSKEPVVEAEESEPQARVERCTACSSKVSLDLKTPKDLIAALQTLPAGEVHTQQSFEGCTSSKGCAGIKLQDGRVTQKFGNLNAFGGENAFKAGSNFGSNLLNGKVSGEPLWWMGANSPFKNVNSESYQSKTSSSYTSSTGGATGAGYGNGLGLSKNSFSNSNLNSFASNGQSKYQSASSSFQSAQEGEIDVANNPFLNGDINLAQSGYQGGQGFVSTQNAGSAFGAGSQSLFTSGTADKFAGVGFGGSSPRPFVTSTGSNVNLIQNEQKAGDYDQFQQTYTDYADTANVNLQAASGGELQQTCAGQGYACVLRSQCSNGVVNTNGAGILQARNGKQYCNTRTEVCCRLPSGGVPQSNLGVGFGTVDTESQGSGVAINTAAIDAQNSYGAQGGFSTLGTSNYNGNGAGYGSTVPVVTAIPAGSSGAFGVGSAGSTGTYGSTLRPSTGQNNFVENDTFGSQSANTNIYRPGAVGTGLKPGIPYLPPADNVNSGTNIVSSTVVPSTFVTTPRPYTTPRPIFTPQPATTPRPFNTPVPVTTRRPFTTARPTYLPPVSSTAAPGYLPPVGEQTINRETFVPSPGYKEGGIILDESRFPSSTRRPTVPVISEIPAGCAAALKCTPIEFCTADGIISNTTVILSRDQDAYRVPLTDCKDLETGRIGKCCRDPFYTDPWPTNQLGKWVHGVFGGNDGKWVPDNRGSSNTIRTQVTGRPFVSGSTILNNFRTTKPTPASFETTSSSTGQNTPGYQVTKYGQGQFTKGGVGQYGQGLIGQVTQTGIGQYENKGQGQIGIQGQGFGIEQGEGAIITQGQGQLIKQGVGQKNKFGLVSQGITQLVENGEGQYTEQGVGQTVIQGGGLGIKQGVGLAVSQGLGSTVENEYSASTHRLQLQRYDGTGQCGVKHGQRPYGNRDRLEVDFAEIPWQAMVLLQTNKSLLCGGVISRPDVVLTSASCVDGLEAKNVLVKGGEWKLGIDDEPLTFQIVHVKTIIFHPGYKSGSLQDDVAILYLAENLKLANNIQPICMPESKDSINAFYGGVGECIVTGWGKVVLQAHLSGSIMHSVNVSLIEPNQCEAKLQQDYPHLLDNYNQESCACGEPTNPLDNICKVDIGSALACTTGDGYYVMQGVYSWDSGCQTGNQLAAFYKFDIEWYEWAIGLTESVTYSQYGRGTKITQTKYTSQVTSQVTSGTKGIQYGGGVKGTVSGGVKGYTVVGQENYAQFGAGQLNKAQAELNAGQGQTGVGQNEFTSGKGQFGIGQTHITTGQSQFGAGQHRQIFGQGQVSSANFSQFSSSTLGKGQFESGSLGQFGKFGKGSTDFSSGSLNLGTDIKGPISNTFSATYTEKKFFKTEPQFITYTTKPEIITYTTKPEIVTFTTKPEIVTFTTKPEIFTYTTKPKFITYTTKPKIITYTTKPKLITYTTKPQFITYETSGSGTNPQYVAPGVTFNPSFSELVGAQHKHNAQCKCNERGKK